MDKSQKTDVVETLLKIANSGAEIHTWDWKAICGNAGVAMNEIQRLRHVENILVVLLKHINDVTHQISEVVEVNKMLFDADFFPDPKKQ